MLHGPIFERLFDMKHWVRLFLLSLALTTGAGVRAQILGKPALPKDEAARQELAWDIYAAGSGNRFAQNNLGLMSLLSGQKSNKINWLAQGSGLDS